MRRMTVDRQIAIGSCIAGLAFTVVMTAVPLYFDLKPVVAYLFWGAAVVFAAVTVWIIFFVIGGDSHFRHPAAKPDHVSDQPTPSIVWDDHLGHTYSGEGAGLLTQAFQIGAVNHLGHELRLERAYIVSGQGAGEKALQVATNNGWVSVDKTLPIGNGQRIEFRVEFGGLVPARTVFENWKTFQITVVHDGGVVSCHDVTEAMVRHVYEGFKPNPIGPQVQAKK